MEVFGNFLRVADFAGREPRRRFWPYVGIVVLIYLVSGWLLMIPAMGMMLAQTSGSNGRLTPESGVGSFAPFFAVIDGEAVLVVCLLAAAVARRLHDSGMSARWGLLPVPFLTFASIGFPLFFSSVMQGAAPNIAAFLALFLNNMAYIACLIVLIVLLCRNSSSGPNRFDAQPA